MTLSVTVFSVSIAISVLGPMIAGAYLFTKVGYPLQRVISNSLWMGAFAFLAGFFWTLLCSIIQMPLTVVAATLPVVVFVFFYTLQRVFLSREAGKEKHGINSEYGFRIVFPEGWKVVKTQLGGVQAVSRNEIGEEAYITIHSEEAKMDHERVLTNNELGNYRVSFFQEQGSTAELLEQGKGAVGQQQGYWAEVHVSGNFPQYEKTYIVIKGSNLFTISTMVTPDDSSWYEHNRPLFEKAISSFEIN